MRVIVDAMSGDNAPSEIVKGAVAAAKEFNIGITLVGDESTVKSCLDGESCDKIQIVHAGDVITMEDDPSTAVRRKKDASMSVGLKLLKDGEGDAFVSAGNTGALLTGATLVVKRIRGIRRGALAPILPNGDKGVMLIDCGANVECTPEYLLQFAYMGSFYMKSVMGVDKPRVGLLNVGTEDTKGGVLQKESFAVLNKAAESGRISFVGNIEGSDAFKDKVDVIVTDGFTGNVMLKTIEGSVGFMMKELKKVFYASGKTKLGAVLVKSELGGMKKSLDVSEIGGTAMLGISKPVIKAHGSSDARAIRSAIMQSIKLIEGGVISQITDNIDHMRVSADDLVG